MPSQDVTFGANAPDRSTGSTDQFAYTDGVSVPQGRIVANGQGPIRVHSIAGFISGVNSAATVSIEFGGTTTGNFGVGQSSSAQSTGARGMTGWVANGGSVRVRYNLDRQCYIGRRTDGSKSVIGGTNSFAGFSLSGYFSYVEGPSDPTNVSVSGGVNQAYLNWGAPADDGGSTVIGYTVAYTLDSSFASGVSYVGTQGAVNSANIQGLQPGSTYHFRVAATNDVTEHFGTKGFYSGTVSAFIAGVPGAPTSLTVSPSVGQASLDWVAPADNGGSVLTGYTVDYATNSGFSGALSTTSSTTNRTITGLTNGATYFFRVRATNSVGTGAPSPAVSTFIASTPGAPTGLSAPISARGIAASWFAPSNDGGVAVLGYRLDYGTDPAFGGYNSVFTDSRTAVITQLVPGTLLYTRVLARNAVGYGAPSSTSSGTAPTRDALDVVKGASVSVGALSVSIRSNGANMPTLTLGYTAFGTGTAFVTIATLPVGSNANQYGIRGGGLNLALTADASGALYVIGTAGNSENVVRATRYGKNGATSWAAPTVLSQALPSTEAPVDQFAVTPTGRGLFMLARRAGALDAGALSFAEIDTNALAAGSGSLFLSSGTDPSWLSSPPSGVAPNTGALSVTTLTPGGNRVALFANGFAVVDLGAVITGVSRAVNGSSYSGAWVRVVGVSTSAFAVLAISGSALRWTFYGTNGAVLGSGSYAGSNALGGAFGGQWDAFYDRVAGLVTAYYLPDDSSLKIESIEISPTTYVATSPAILTTTFGTGSNSSLRVPSGDVDERRVIVEAGNVSSSVKSTAVYSDRSGNLAPTAPATVDEGGYDASSARNFSWTFGDPNPLDAQTAYDFEIQRVSDSVNVVTSGKVVSATGSRAVAANALINGVAYRWRARTYDALDVAGTYSAYDAFSTSALGTLTITSPATDNPAGFELASFSVTWSFSQANGYVQTQRRLRVLRVSDSAVLSDTGMSASTATSYTVGPLGSGVPVAIEVSIVTNAPGTPTATTTRLITPSYSEPMIPTVTLSVGESYVAIVAVNPAPTGSRPEVVRNDVTRRLAGSGTPFLIVGSMPNGGTYLDRAVASGASYDYQVIGVTA